jgi:hypothetical protein
MGACLVLLFLYSTIISFVLITLRERLLSWHHNPIGCLVIDQAYHCCVIGKLNDSVGVVPGHAVMSEQEGTEHAHLRGPRVEDQCGRCVVTYPYHLCAAVRKSRIQLQREAFSPRVLRLVMSFEGTIVLNAEL